MSTRVEKGGPKFKPILKSKARIPPLASALEGRARSSVEPAQPVLPQVASTQEAPSTESPPSHDVSRTSSFVLSNASNEPRATSSPSKPPGIPIIISRAHMATTSAPNEALVSSVADPGPSSTSKTPPTRDPHPSGDKRQDTNAPKHSSVSQKQPKQSFLDAEEKLRKKRSTRGTKKTTVEEAPNIEPVPAKERQKCSSPGENSNQDRPSRRQRSESSSREDSAQADGGDQHMNGSRPKKKRKKTVVEESSAEPIDPTQITMRAICDDLGAGRKSSRWESSQTLYGEARKRAKEERARHILETEQQERETGRASKKGVPLKPPLSKETLRGDGEHNEDQRDEFSYDETLKTSHYAPQVRIGANGEIVLDVDSLQVDRSADPDLIEEYSHIEENDHSKFTNSSSWSKRRLVRWGKEDTALFYDALRQFGQNFDLIARVLPGKTYRMCKNKFKAEDKRNPALIDEALKNAVAVDLNTLSRMTGKNFTGPMPIITPRSTINFGDADNSTAPQQPESNIPEIRSAEAGDKGTSTEFTLASELSALGGTFSTSRGSESPPPPGTLLEKS